MIQSQEQIKSKLRRMRLELLHAHLQILLAECRQESPETPGTESAMTICVGASQPHGLL